MHDRDRDHARAFSPSENREANESKSLPGSERRKKQSALVQSLCKLTRLLGCLFVCLFVCFFPSRAVHVILLRKNGCPFPLQSCRTSGDVEKKKKTQVQYCIISRCPFAFAIFAHQLRLARDALFRRARPRYAAAPLSK